MKIRIYRCEFGSPRLWCFEIDDPRDVNGVLYGYRSSWAGALEGARDHVTASERERSLFRSARPLRRDIPRLLR